jgi:hypothetical protein
LKKSTVLTATHSLMSSPSGSITASRKFPVSAVTVLVVKEKWLLHLRGGGGGMGPLHKREKVNFFNERSPPIL